MNLAAGNQTCPDCAASNPPGAALCWLCYHSFADEPPLPPPLPGSIRKVRAFPDRSALESNDVLAGIGAATLAVCVGIGAILAQEAIGIGLFSLLVPSALIALGYVVRQWRRGEQLGFWEKFLGAFGGAVVVGLLGLAALIACFVLCLSLILPTHIH
jgi:hypothetical protein